MIYYLRFKLIVEYIQQISYCSKNLFKECFIWIYKQGVPRTTSICSVRTVHFKVSANFLIKIKNCLGDFFVHISAVFHSYYLLFLSNKGSSPLHTILRHSENHLSLDWAFTKNVLTVCVDISNNFKVSSS